MSEHKSSYFLLGILLFLYVVFIVSCQQSEKDETQKKPNVILIMTDDQGIGDFGFTGNPYIKTPHIDNLASHSAMLTNFYVSPVCAPTRASLMTGKYNERTGVYDTYNGGAIMSTEEVTFAEVMRGNGYETGIFGKWHLGDNYPYRPMDQGFDVSVIHKAGGMGQPGDIFNFFAGDSSYFDPILFRNGEPVQTYGYCSDVFTDELIQFLKSNQKKEPYKPFFAYLSFNAPHTPLQLPEEYYNLYKEIEFSADSFAIYDEAVKNMTPRETEAAKRVYGMVTNIDDNIGKLMQFLKDQEIEENTIVVFLTDNGPQQNRYKLGLRMRKSSVYGGGVRVPCLIHYPARFPEKQEINKTLAHIDLLPSILDLCGLDPVEHKIDGKSFMSGDDQIIKAIDDRTLFFEWGRGFLKKYRNFSALNNPFKLVGNTAHNASIEQFELYNIDRDPQEKNNIVAESLDIATKLKSEMDAWYDEIIQEENNRRTFPAFIGTPHENPVLLNRNDAKGTPPAWVGDQNLNYWEVKSLEDGIYDVTLHFIEPVNDPGNVVLKMYPYNFSHSNRKTIKSWTFKNVEIKKGEYRVEPSYQTNNRSYIFPFYVAVHRIDK